MYLKKYWILYIVVAILSGCIMSYFVYLHKTIGYPIANHAGVIFTSGFPMFLVLFYTDIKEMDHTIKHNKKR